TLTQEEVLDIFFEDLELPNLIKTDLKEISSLSFRRAGVTTAGTPNNINLIRTMRNSYGRRLALKRPRSEELDQLKERLFALESSALQREDDLPKKDRFWRAIVLRGPRRRWTPSTNPIAVRNTSSEPQPIPSSQAVMFCLMDVSGSMGEREKDLAKRFYILLH